MSQVRARWTENLRRYLISSHSCIIKETKDRVPTGRGHWVTLKSSDLLKISGATWEAAYRKICLPDEDGDEPAEGGTGKKKKAAKGASAARVTSRDRRWRPPLARPSL